MASNMNSLAFVFPPAALLRIDRFSEIIVVETLPLSSEAN